jgi:hypothetical protein
MHQVDRRIKTVQDLMDDMKKGMKEFKILTPYIDDHHTKENVIKYLPLLGMSHRNIMRIKHKFKMPISPEEVTDEVMIDLL